MLLPPPVIGPGCLGGCGPCSWDDPLLPNSPCTPHPSPFRLSCLSPSAPTFHPPNKQGSPGDISRLLAPGSLMPVWHLLLLPFPPPLKPWLSLEVPGSCLGQLLANVMYLVLSQMLRVLLGQPCVPGVLPTLFCLHRGHSLRGHPWQVGVSSRCCPGAPALLSNLCSLLPPAPP